MKIKRTLRIAFLFVLLFAGKNAAVQAQTGLYWEPEFKLAVSTDTPWSYTFGIANRNRFAEYLDGEKVAGAQEEHIELNYFTSYRTSENTSVALGFRYRFRELFDDERYDEFRTIQQFSIKQPETFLNFSHRFRFEQRFRNVITVFRPRYQLSVARTLGEDFGVGLATEFLYSMAQGIEPEADQRFTFEVEYTASDDLEFSAGIELRHENFNNAAENSFYILSGATYKL